MVDHPILFSGEMVKAILDGRKTQTRRVIKPQPWPQESQAPGGSWAWSPRSKLEGQDSVELIRSKAPHAVWCVGHGSIAMPRLCPYGQPGDRLWVRETWATTGNFDHIKPSELPLTHFSAESHMAYRATAEYGDAYYKWRPSIFMPRWASRITLEIQGVRVERVQEITKESILAEGLPDRWQQASNICHLNSWIRLWDSINAKRGFSWKSNPWVWVIEFRRVES